MRAKPEVWKYFILGDFFAAENSHCRFDERLSVKEDYDFTRSHLEAFGEVDSAVTATTAVIVAVVVAQVVVIVGVVGVIVPTRHWYPLAYFPMNVAPKETLRSMELSPKGTLFRTAHCFR